MDAVNPATGELIRRYETHSAEEVDSRLRRAEEAFASWRRRPLAERTAVLSAAAAVLRSKVDEYALLITQEMGKPIGEARGEVEKCAWVCEHYAAEAEAILEPRPVETDASQSLVRYDPIGPVLAVMPWNFPFWQVFRFAAPALAAGNVGLLKHASNVPGSALAIEEIFREAGLPEGCFQTLLIPGREVGRVISDPAVRAVTLTGSEGAGAQVAAAAGREIKKTVLELGGSDAFVVLADADLDAAAEAGVRSRTLNSGQSCIAAKRFVVEETVYEPFLERLAARTAALVVGDPTDPATQVGPLARPDLVDDLASQVERTVAAGGRLVTGGERLDRPGNFYAPTVLAEVEPGMAAFDEETFGPVAAVVKAQGEEHAIELANRSRYGLGGSLWTADTARGARLAAEIEAGAVFVNGMVKSDPRLPFGGIKLSGYGRELAADGLREFVNIKSVWIG